MAVIKSLLKEAVEQFPTDQTIKGSALPNLFKKQGVKDEELQFAALDIDPAKRYSAEELKGLEAGRQDQFTELEGATPNSRRFPEDAIKFEARYEFTNINTDFKDTTYAEDIFTFNKPAQQMAASNESSAIPTETVRDIFNQLTNSPGGNSYVDTRNRLMERYNIQDETVLDMIHDSGEEAIGNTWYDTANAVSKSGEGSRYTSTHYRDVPNYLMHARRYDDVVEGKNTRVLIELQSDLHQEGRRTGYTGGEPVQQPGTEQILNEWNEYTEAIGRPDLQDMTMDEAAESLRQTGDVEGAEEAAEFDNRWMNAMNAEDEGASTVPVSPFEKTWARKTLERSYVKALNDGMEQLAIPIKGGNVGGLARAKGVQEEFYENTILNTAKKMAKELTKAGNPTDFKLVGDFEGMAHTDAKQALNELVVSAGSHKLVDKLEGMAKQYDKTDPYKAKLIRDAVATDDMMLRNNILSRFSKALPISQMPTSLKDTVEDALLDLNLVLSNQKPTHSTITIEEFNERYDDILDHIAGSMGESSPLYKLLNDASNENITIDEALAKLNTKHYNAGEVFAVLTPKDAPASKANVSFNLYSTPLAGAGAAYLALKSGYTEDQITEDFVGRGEDPEDVQAALAKGKFIQKAVETGWSEEEAKAYLAKEEPKIESIESMTMDEIEDVLATGVPKNRPWLAKALFPEAETLDYDIPQSLIESTIEKRKAQNADSIFGHWQESALTPESVERSISLQLRNKARSYNELTDLDTQMNVEEFLATMQAVQPNLSSITTRAVGYFGNDSAKRTAQKAEAAAKQRIVNIAKRDFGIGLAWYDDADPDTGAILGDNGYWTMETPEGEVPVSPALWKSLKSEGFEIAGAVAGAVAGAKYTPGNFVTKMIGSVGGAAVGGAAGSQLDYLQNVMNVHQELNRSVAAHRALTAGEASVLGDIIAYPIVKGLGLGWDVIRLAKSKLAGSEGAAAKELKNLMYLSDDEAVEIVGGFKAVGDMPKLGKSAEEIATIVATQPGGEEIMRIAGSIDPTANRAMAQSIKSRANDVLETAGNLTEESIGRLLKDDLHNYENSVKTFYESVKQEAIQSPRSAMFTFDMEKLSIEPILAAMEKEILDLPVAERFMRKAAVINSRTDSRTFGDLIELRKILNSFRSSGGMKKATDLKMFQELMQNVDGAIEDGAGYVMANPGKWLDDWTTSNAEYAKMKQTQKNVLYKLLTRDGVNQDQIVKGLTRFVTSLDGTWDDVFSKLPPNAKVKAEGAVINALTDKYTAGVGEGMRAVNFPMLSDALSQVTFNSTENRKFVAAIDRMAKTFRNDVPLSQSTGSIIIPKEQSYLTTDPVVRLQYEFASSLFNYVKRLMPTKKGRALNLMLKTADILEKPLNAKAIRDLIEEMGDSMDIAPKLLELQQAAATAAANGTGTAKVNLYGEGNILAMQGTGKPTTQIAMDKVAKTEDVERIAKIAGLRVTDKQLTWHLKQAGYLAKQSGSDKIEVLK